VGGNPRQYWLKAGNGKVRVERTRSFGAEVILHGESLDEAGTLTQQLLHKQGLYLVHPYDDAHIIAG
jgi:threonine dehydratase